MMHGDGEVGPAHSSEEAGEQGGARPRRSRGAKGRGQGECGTAKHGPDAEPGSRVTGAGPPTRSRHQEQTGEADGAPASSSASTFCGRAFFGLKKSRSAGRRRDDLGPSTRKTLRTNLVGSPRSRPPGAYRALPSRRRYIPKADGRQRPLGIAALEDKIVQAAVVAILTPIYEAEFLGFSYGFRPGRGQHDALDALAFGIGRQRINWILDADIRSFFDTISQDWLVRFVEHRIGDRTDHPPDRRSG